MFVALSWLGSYGAVWVAIGLLVTVALRRPDVLVLVGGAVVATHLVTTVLKGAVDRPRPPARFPRIDMFVSIPSSASFPSGHAATSFAAATALAVVLPRYAPVFVAVACAIAFSRLYVGVHYPLDVLAGAALGTLIATALLLLARARRR